MLEKYHLVDHKATYTKTKCGRGHVMLVTEVKENVTCKRCLAALGVYREAKERRKHIEEVLGY